MGYRSQVQCVIYGTKDNMQAYLTKQVLICGSTILSHFRHDLKYYKASDGNTYILHLAGDDWKWYESHGDVQAWNIFMEESTEMGLEYEFIRIGEETGDIERHESAHSKGYLYTSNPIIENDFDDDTEIPLPF